MTLEERILMRYTSLSWKEVQQMKADFETSELAMQRHIRDMKPHLRQAPEFLAIDALAKPLTKLMYGDICAYGWALRFLQGFAECRAVAERHGQKVNMRTPNNELDYISPAIFHGFIWGVFKQYKLQLYSQLPGVTLKVKRRQYELSNEQLEAFKARGLRAWCGQYELYFEGDVSNDYSYQYREKGYVPIYNFEKSTARVIEKEVQRCFPNAHLQYDPDYGVVVR